LPCAPVTATRIFHLLTKKSRLPRPHSSSGVPLCQSAPSLGAPCALSTSIPTPDTGYFPFNLEGIALIARLSGLSL
jgi:hypothetical protein